MRYFGGFLLLFVLLMPSNLMAAAPYPWEVGLRGGMDATGSIENYMAGEVYAQRRLPWEADLGHGMKLYTRLDGGVGILEADSDEGAWVAVGADLVFSLMDGLVELEGGFRPTWISDYKFGSDDYGGQMQFSSHGGIALNIDQLSINYRFQHISNAGIYGSNPGIDLHLFGLGYRF